MSSKEERSKISIFSPFILKYDSHDGLNGFKRNASSYRDYIIENGSIEDLKYYDKVVNVYTNKFRRYSDFHKVNFINAGFIIENESGNGTIYNNMSFLPEFLESKYDWLLLVFLVIALIIILIATVDYYFYSKREFDLKMTSVLF